MIQTYLEQCFSTSCHLPCLFLGACLVQCRVFSSTPGLYPLDASNTPTLSPIIIIKNVSRHPQMSPAGSGGGGALSFENAD